MPHAKKPSSRRSAKHLQLDLRRSKIKSRPGRSRRRKRSDERRPLSQKKGKKKPGLRHNALKLRQHRLGRGNCKDNSKLLMTRIPLRTRTIMIKTPLKHRLQHLEARRSRHQHLPFLPTCPQSQLQPSPLACPSQVQHQLMRQLTIRSLRSWHHKQVKPRLRARIPRPNQQTRSIVKCLPLRKPLKQNLLLSSLLAQEHPANVHKRMTGLQPVLTMTTLPMMMDLVLVVLAT